MPYQTLQEDIRLLQQSDRQNYASVELLNNTFKTIDKMEGQLISDSFTFDATSDIRRTYTLTFICSDSSYDTGEQSKIWLNKYIKVKIGIYNMRTDDINWYPMGTYLFTESDYKYDAVSNTLQVTCVDLMSKLTGLRNGQITGLTTTISEGNNLRDVFISTITDLGGFTKYRIEDLHKTIPYDLSFSTGATVYDILVALRDLYSGYEIFFDIDDTFVFQAIPTCEDEEDILTFDELNPLVISEETKNDFSNIKNCTEVWGETISPDRYTDNVSVSNNTYILTFDSDITLTSGIYVAFKAPSNNVANMKIQFVYASTFSNVYNILNEDGTNIIADKIVAGKAYVVKYSNSTIKFLGQNQIYAICKDENTDSPYCISKIGEIYQILSDGEYAKIYSDDLALERAEYENWQKTRLEDTTTLTTITIPWLDVNKKISYTSERTGITQEYIIKTLSGSVMTGTMTIEMIKYYPLFPDIIT